MTEIIFTELVQYARIIAKYERILNNKSISMLSVKRCRQWMGNKIYLQWPKLSKVISI